MSNNGVKMDKINYGRASDAVNRLISQPFAMVNASDEIVADFTAVASLAFRAHLKHARIEYGDRDCLGDAVTDAAAKWLLAAYWECVRLNTAWKSPMLYVNDIDEYAIELRNGDRDLDVNIGAGGTRAFKTDEIGGSVRMVDCDDDSPESMIRWLFRGDPIVVPDP
jgi:hypothetical protein